MKHWGLMGCIERVVQVTRRWVNRATLNKTKWEGKQLAMTASHPHMRKLPFPVQRLIGREARLAVGLEQKPWPIPPIGDDAKCKCKFYVSYLLPCRHIFWTENYFGGVLSDHHWERWLHMFEQEVSGFEIYESIGEEFISEEI
jgi:hypothetical protein